MSKKIILFLCLLFYFSISKAQLDSLRIKIEDILKTKNAKVGVSIIANNYKDTISINGETHFPMQSVFKFPISLAVLSEIDKKTFLLNQKIKITSKELLLDAWSPIKDKFPNGTSLTIGEIIEYTISQSDNIGCDILLNLIGGTKFVEDFLVKNNFINFSIKANEAEMHKEWNVQFLNWTTPNAMNNLLIKSFNNTFHLISQNSHVFIWRVMKETSTGKKRLRGQLPAQTVVFHKAGSSGNKDNITAATNDVGVIILPNENPLFISIFITNSKENEETNEKIISDIAKFTWDYYSKK